jgi:hypothetical protein
MANPRKNVRGQGGGSTILLRVVLFSLHLTATHTMAYNIQVDQVRGEQWHPTV